MIGNRESGIGQGDGNREPGTGNRDFERACTRVAGGWNTAIAVLGTSCAALETRLRRRRLPRRHPAHVRRRASET